VIPTLGMPQKASLTEGKSMTCWNGPDPPPEVTLEHPAGGMLETNCAISV